MADPSRVSAVRDKFESLAAIMDERMRRYWAASEALAMGRGGISAVCEATGISRTTIRAGIAELREGPKAAGREPDRDRIRRAERL